MPTTYYISILANGGPFAFNVDENSRTMFSTNYEAKAISPADSIELDFAKVINNNALGTLNTDMFIGPAAIIPTGNGPYINIIDTGGLRDEQVHSADSTIENLSAQIVVRGLDPVAAKTRALAIWRALRRIRNTSIVR